MRRAQLPITALPAWAKLNDVDFLDTYCIDLGSSKGFGIATSRALSSEDVVDLPTLLIIPQDLILSTDSVEEHLKVDQHFRQLVDVAGGTSLRDNVMLFLLMQITVTSPEHKQNVGLSNPWTQYVQVMPASVPVPTLWSEEERYMLTGTSLEAAVNAKLAKLQKEFDELHEKTAAIPWCVKCWWENNSLKLSDWVLLDAWYRSRSLELPNSGEALVPCLDMANHSSNSVAYWEQIESNKVALLLRPGLNLEKGAEITISYGSDKSAAEFLFSYGFIDETSSNASLLLALPPFPDDPLGKAKVQAFTGTPTVKISRQGDVVVWESPFLYFMCLNEEDGLEFRVLQQVDGLRSPLRVFWQERDVTEETDKFEDMIADHALKEVFRLRVLALLHDRIRQQLEGFYESEDMVNSIAMLADPSRQGSVMLLRNLETGVLEEAFEDVEMRKQELLQNETVRRYLGSMEDNVNEARLEEGEDEANDEEDFS